MGGRRASEALDKALRNAHAEAELTPGQQACTTQSPPRPPQVDTVSRIGERQGIKRTEKAGDRSLASTPSRRFAKQERFSLRKTHEYLALPAVRLWLLHLGGPSAVGRRATQICDGNLSARAKSSALHGC